ncbi:MAG: SCO family protein [Myxococcota bacterium]
MARETAAAPRAQGGAVRPVHPEDRRAVGSRRGWKPRRLIASGLTSLLIAAAACGLPAEQTYTVEGTVEGVDREHAQIRVAHEAIPGFMPAMTMNFDVAPERLEGLERGARIRFRLERKATTLRIVDLEVTGRGEPSAPGPPAAGRPLEEAPDFELLDHWGRRFRLSSLRGRGVLLDFIFTRCAGPCPILTRAHAELQRRLPPGLAGRMHFVSVSLDPEYDTPVRLRRYAWERGAKLESWTFLTGSPTEIQRVLEAYQVGAVRTSEDSLDHAVVSYLIGPDGQVTQRYLGLEHPLQELLGDIEALLGEAAFSSE